MQISMHVASTSIEEAWAETLLIPPPDSVPMWGEMEDSGSCGFIPTKQNGSNRQKSQARKPAIKRREARAAEARERQEEARRFFEQKWQDSAEGRHDNQRHHKWTLLGKPKRSTNM